MYVIIIIMYVIIICDNYNNVISNYNIIIVIICDVIINVLPSGKQYTASHHEKHLHMIFLNEGSSAWP